jgi:hypothetical protein
MNDRLDQHVDVDRLGHDGVESRVHGARAIFRTRKAGARDRRCAAALFRRQMAHAANQREPVLARHAEI